MRISISAADRQSAMPQIKFTGDVAAICAKVAPMGYEGLDLFFPKPSETDVAAVRRALEANGLQVTMLGAHADLMAQGLFLNRHATLPRLLEESRSHLAICAELKGMPNVGFFRGQHKDVPGGREESLKYMAEGLHAYCELAASYGVTVLLENINRYEIDSIHTVAHAMDLLERAGAPANLRLLVDVFHMNIEESSLSAAIARGGDRIGHVHFVDNTRAVPGFGCLDLDSLAECLGVAGYEGFLGLEAIPGDRPEEEAREGLAAVRAMLARPSLRRPA